MPRQKKIGFLSDMMMRTAETILSESCRKNWHNEFLSMHDRGHMALIREESGVLSFWFGAEGEASRTGDTG